MRFHPTAVIGMLVLFFAWGARGQSLTPGSPGPNAETQIAKPAPPADPAPPHVTPLGTGLSAYQGLRVSDIQFRSKAPLDADRLRAMIAQKVNEPLERSKLRASIQTLYATGNFSDIQVEAQKQDPNDVSLVFVATENYFIGLVRVQGAPKRPTTTQLVNAAKLPLGGVFTRERLEDALNRMKALLADNGYYKAAITPQFSYRDQDQEVDATFYVTPGELAILGKVEVTGDSGFTVAQVEEITGLHPGDHVSRKRMTDAIQRLHKRYEKADRLEAEIAVLKREYHPETNTVDYALQVDRGPVVDVRVHGAKLRKGLVKKYVPVFEENEVDDDLLAEGRRNIRDHYQTKGYFDVNVGVDQHPEPSGGLVHVDYNVELGKRHKLAAIDFQGNHYFDAETLRQWMVVEPAGELGLFHGRYSQSLLARDIDTIVTQYQANGFEHVQITPEVQDNYRGAKGHMRVLLHVNEGPQTRVAKLEITGNKAFSSDQIMEVINTLPGQPFSASNMAGDRNQVVTLYFNQGFPNAEMEYSAKRVPGHPNAMDVVYKIKEGEQFFVNRVIVVGSQKTKPYVIHRELQVHNGAPLSQLEMLQTQQRLYDLGIFNEVDTAIQNPEGEAQRKDVIVAVEEAKRYTFTYGFGLEFATGQLPSNTQPGGVTGVSPRVSFELTRLNFRGRNDTVILKTRVGRLEQLGLFSYESPRWFDQDNLKLTFNALYDKTIDVHTFTAQRLEGSVQAEHVVTKATRFLYRFSYRRVSVDASTLVIDPNLIPLYSRPVRVGMPSITYIRDNRDDPIESHRGSFNTLDMGVSASVFGSEANFSRFLFQNSTYYSFKNKKYVLARSTRIGVEYPFGGLAEDFIPLPERFFAGGGNTQRGFSINQAGPRDHETGFPIGGNALWLNNVELRMPPLELPFFGNSVSPVVFYDMGNVFSTAQSMFHNLLNFKQDTRGCRLLTISATCNLDYVSHAIGGGIRYHTPIGPVRIDLGYNLNPPLYPIRDEARSTQLRHLNVYFSIGQTF